MSELPAHELLVPLTCEILRRFCRAVRDLHEERPHVTGRDWPLVLYNTKLRVPGNQRAGFLKSEALLKVSTQRRMITHC